MEAAAAVRVGVVGMRVLLLLVPGRRGCRRRSRSSSPLRLKLLLQVPHAVEEDIGEEAKALHNLKGLLKKNYSLLPGNKVSLLSDPHITASPQLAPPFDMSVHPRSPYPNPNPSLICYAAAFALSPLLPSDPQILISRLGGTQE